jgi:hypothetical protein
MQSCPDIRRTRSTWRPGLLLAGVGILVSLTAAAPEALTVDQLLDRHLKATGGQNAWNKLYSRRSLGTVEIAGVGLSAAWEMLAKAPNKRLSRIDVPGYGAATDGFDGQRAWSMNPVSGLTEKRGDELARIRRETEFQRDIRLRQIYPQLKRAGEDKVGNEAVYVVEAVPAAGRPERFYFSQKTSLLLRHDSSFEGPEGVTRLEVKYSDHRRVDGVQFPFKVEVRAEPPNGPEANLTVTCTNVVHNLAIDDARFAPPEGSP